jgi:hypothetical protein
LNNLVFDSEGLNNILEGKPISRQDIIGIYQKAVKNPNDLFSIAQSLRKNSKKTL